jgi:hypothetical protein
MKTDVIIFSNAEKLDFNDIHGGQMVYGKGIVYELSFLAGYAFAWIADYTGDHASKYGQAFK